VATVLVASGAAILVLLAGNLLWAGLPGIGGLASWNMRAEILLPWAILPGAVYLWVYWQLISGRRWTAPTDRRERAANLRANRVAARLWPLALAAGLVGFAALLALLSVLARLVPLPAGQPIATPAGMPLATAVLLLVMQSVTAGVTEEAAFRGYMQSMIERRSGLLVAIVACGTLFGLLHFGNHPGAVLLMLPYYVAVSAVYGGLTWATDSILPALVLHSAGDAVVLVRWWRTGRPEWQLGAARPTLLSDSGVDGSFLLGVAVLIALAGLTGWAYRRIRRLRLADVRSSARAGVS